MQAFAFFHLRLELTLRPHKVREYAARMDQSVGHHSIIIVSWAIDIYRLYQVCNLIKNCEIRQCHATVDAIRRVQAGENSTVLVPLKKGIADLSENSGPVLGGWG